MNRLGRLPDLMLAPNGARKGKADHPALPISIPEIVDEALKCHREGAGALHAHVRDGAGRHALDAGLYRELIAEMRVRAPDMPVQITTEAAGLFMPSEQMSVVYDVHPEGVSASIRELWRDPDMRAEASRFFAWCREAEISVQHIFYDPSDIRLLADLVQGNALPRPNQCIFVLGSYVNKRVGTPDEVAPFLGICTKAFGTLDWAACAFGPREHECLVEAARLGGKMRVGFENNISLPDGTPFTDNVHSVRHLMQLVAATPREEAVHV